MTAAFFGVSPQSLTVRWAALRLLKTQNDESLCEQEPGGFCRGEPCALCRIFGSPWRYGKATFSEAYPVEEQRELLNLIKAVNRTAGMTVKATTGIDRTRRVVKKDHLFSTEVAPPLTFEAMIEGRLDTSERELIEKCATILTHFGADGARGLGLCRYELEAWS